jgi:hypothetical protein
VPAMGAAFWDAGSEGLDVAIERQLGGLREVEILRMGGKVGGEARLRYGANGCAVCLGNDRGVCRVRAFIDARRCWQVLDM